MFYTLITGACSDLKQGSLRKLLKVNFHRMRFSAEIRGVCRGKRVDAPRRVSQLGWTNARIHPFIFAYTRH